MFKVQTGVIIVASTEARRALGAQLKPAGLAAWGELARLRCGLEMAHFPLVHDGIRLAVSSELRRDGLIEITIGLGDPRLATRVIPASTLQRAEAGVRRQLSLAGDRVWNVKLYR